VDTGQVSTQLRGRPLRAEHPYDHNLRTIEPKMSVTSALSNVDTDFGFVTSIAHGGRTDRRTRMTRNTDRSSGCIIHSSAEPSRHRQKGSFRPGGGLTYAKGPHARYEKNFQFFEKYIQNI